MKIGLLTWFNRGQNCGQTLQAFALQKKFNQRFGKGTCILIDYQYGYRKKYLHKGIWSAYVIYSVIKNKQLARYISFHSFIKKEMVPISPTLFSDRDIEAWAASKELSGIVLGSDQIWNPQSGAIPNAMKLNINANIKKIAFAPSMCSFDLREKYSSDIRDLASVINSFDFVGVREGSAVAILSEYTNIKIEKMLDPVFLLNEHEWHVFENNQYLDYIKQDYILVYCVGNISSELLNTVNLIKAKYTINTVLFVQTDSDSNDWITLNDVGPREFLTLVANASFVVCDSFHATAFSIIYRKDFYVLPAVKRDHTPNPDRIIDMLMEFGLSNRFIKHIDTVTHVDYCDVMEKINNRIAILQLKFDDICNILTLDNKAL